MSRSRGLEFEHEHEHDEHMRFSDSFSSHTTANELFTLASFSCEQLTGLHCLNFTSFKWITSSLPPQVSLSTLRASFLSRKSMLEQHLRGLCSVTSSTTSAQSGLSGVREPPNFLHCSALSDFVLNSHSSLTFLTSCLRHNRAFVHGPCDYLVHFDGHSSYSTYNASTYDVLLSSHM